MDQKLITSVLTTTNVDGSLLMGFCKTVTATIAKWEGRQLARSLGHFNAAPCTLPEEITSKKEKRDAKEEAKCLKTEHQYNDQCNGGQPPNGGMSHNQLSFGNFNGNLGSIPTKGFIKAMPTNASLLNQPHLPHDNLPCPDFIIQGRYCSNGQNCQYAHLTSLMIHPDKIPDYDNWITSIPALSWAHPPQGSRFHQQTQTNQQTQQTNTRNNGGGCNTPSNQGNCCSSQISDTTMYLTIVETYHYI